MKYWLVLLLGAVMVSACDTTTGGKGPEDEDLGLTGIWTRVDHSYPPVLFLDAQALHFTVDYWADWSRHETCTREAAGPVAAITDSSIVLEGLQGIPIYSRTVSDTLSYDAVDDVLITSQWLPGSPDEVSHFVYSRVDTTEFDLIEPFCVDLVDRFTGDWTLTAAADSTGDVLATWQAAYPSWVMNVDETGNGNHQIQAADGTVYTFLVDILFDDEHTKTRIYLYGTFPGSGTEPYLQTEVVDDGLQLFISGNEVFWNRAFNTSLDGSTGFTFTRQ